jgi:hypothetical protein
MILFFFANPTAQYYKGNVVEQNPDTYSILINEINNADLSFVKLHSNLAFLMTRFHQHQCPKLAHIIVKHIFLLLEHPDLANFPHCRSIYLQQIPEWQKITLSLFINKGAVPQDGKITH